MRATRIVGAGLRLWSENWRRWGLVTLALSGVATLALAAIDPWTATYGSRHWFDHQYQAPDPEPLAILVTLVSGLLLGPWLYVILTKASLERTIETGSKPLIGRTINGVRSLLWIALILVLYLIVALIPILLIGGALVAITPDDVERNVLLFVPLLTLAAVIWIGPRLAILIDVFVGEDARGIKAIGETWRRTRGAWGTAAGALLLGLLVGIGMGLIPSVIAANAFPLPTVADAIPRATIIALTGAITTPIGIAVGSVLYLELTARKGLLSQARLRLALSRFDATP
jgi:hypothetical protein